MLKMQIELKMDSVCNLYIMNSSKNSFERMFFQHLKTIIKFSKEVAHITQE